MILDALFQFFSNALNFFFGLLPSWSPFNLGGAGSALASVTSGMISVIDWADFYVPAKLACSLLIGMWVFQAAVYVFNFVVWVATKIHLLGGE